MSNYTVPDAPDVEEEVAEVVSPLSWSQRRRWGGGGRGGGAVPDVEEVPEVLSPRPWNQRRRRRGGRRGDGEGGLTAFPAVLQ